MTTSTRQNNFDFIRLVCASAVIWSHSYVLLGVDIDPFLQLTGERAGTLAVSAFFVTSGYLVFGSLSSGRSLPFYTVSRFLRIVPALAILCMATVFLLGPLASSLKVADYFARSETWGYLSNIVVIPQKCCLPGVFESNFVPFVINGSLWTLSVEVFCYIALGLLWSIGLRGVAAVGALLGVVATSYTIAVANNVGWSYPLSVLGIPVFGILQNSLYFVIGMFLYKIRASLPVSGLLAITCILGVVFGGQIGHLIAIAYLVFYVAFAGLRLYKFTNRFGDISYGVYIYGFPVQQTLVFAVSDELTPATLTISALLITYVIGFASWWLFEEPALSLKDRLL